MDKSLLKRALEDTEDPTPGYMFRDIAQWTFIDHNTQTKLIAFLMDKLRPTASVHVLAKTLRVLKVLCETGHTDFQKEMQRRSDDLKQFASYRGKPDAKFGDKLNEKVRATAREAIDAAFSHRKETKVQVLKGHGSDSTYEETNTTFTTGSKVTSESNGWFGGSSAAPAGGNANMAPMPTTNKWAEHMAQVASGKGPSVAGAGPGVVTSFVDAAKTGFGLWQENVKTTEQLVMESMNNGTEFRPVDLGFGGQGFGGGAGGGGHSSSAGSGAGGWKFTEEGGAGGAGVKQEALKILTPFQAEVERICNFKSTPQRVELTQFLTAIEEISDRRNSSDLEELGEVLDEHLQQKYNWQHRLNAMSAIEALLRHQSLDGRESFEQYFKENPEDVQRNIHVVQGSLKEKAQKVLKLLGVPERTKGQNETSAVHQPAQQISVATNAGGFSWASPTPVVEASREASAEASNDISLGGMTVKSRSAKPQEDKTKLRKRAAMKVADEDESPPVAPQQVAKPAQQQQQASSSAGWGNDSNATTANSWGSWGGEQTSAQSSQGWGFDAPVAQQQQQQQQPQPVVPVQQQQQQQQQKPKDALDDLFGGPANSWGSSVTPQATSPQLQPAPQSAPAPVAPAPAAPAPPAPGINMQMVMQMQQQLQMMLTQINMSDPNAVAQMQALMAQQQQLMAMVTAAQQPAAAAAPQASQQPEEAVVPHSHFAVQKPQPAAPPLNDSFAAVQQEMMSRMRPQ
ncbi:Hypothetical protein, putative [Bodo saltans]|uniref:ENTH domain-containing protein n=1 Tax=Bodo saltans TaxID=75058 RepID=A0A0S4J7D3_BODSA|nr:Hypothetical protein, putative [Bodo saltans]|eukprot:CUG84380.1 Hypothetical protein, putative [Bodo saltans]